MVYYSAKLRVKPLQTRGCDAFACLQQRGQHLVLQGPCALHDVAGFFDSLVEALFASHFQQRLFRHRDKDLIGCFR